MFISLSIFAWKHSDGIDRMMKWYETRSIAIIITVLSSNM